MAKTRGAHTYRPWVCQGPSPPAAGPSPAAAGSSAADTAAADPTSTAAGPSATVAGAGPNSLAARPTAAPAAGDAVGSSSMAPAQRRYHTRVGPAPPVPSHPNQPGESCRPRGPGHQAQGSHHHRDPGPCPLYLIRVLSEPQTCPWGPSSGGLTSPATPSLGMLATGIEIFMGKCTMISRPLPWTWGSETPCSSFSDTI